MKGKNWLITHNNPKVDPEEYIAKWAPLCTYVNGQLEKGEDGTVHIQCYIALKVEARLTGLKKHDSVAHFELVKRDNGASAYCMKEETRVAGPWSHGTKPMARQSATDWEAVWTNAKAGKVEDIPADIRMRCYGAIKHIKKDYQQIEERKEEKVCYWYQGPSGTGKTRKATEENPNIYKKLANKWWDGYQDQKVVLIDDMPMETAKMLTYHLKLWADPWQNQPGETKGGMAALTYDKLIVTSNYGIDEIWTPGTPDYQAIRRRFNEIFFN